MTQCVLLNPGGTAVVTWFAGPQPDQANYAEIADDDPRFVVWQADQQKAQGLRRPAIAALAGSDATMNRIAEAVALGLSSWTSPDVVAWVKYRRSLRGIVTGASSATALPARPAFPSGT